MIYYPNGYTDLHVAERMIPEEVVQITSITSRKTVADLQELRLDIDFMHDELKVDRLDEYLSLFKSKVMEETVSLLKGVYL